MLLLSFSIILFFINSIICDLTIDWGIDTGDYGTSRVSTGDTVTWVWVDEDTPHSVTSTDFESSPVVSKKGYTFSVVFNTLGYFSFSCSIHPKMQGVIRVTDLTPTSTPTSRPTTRRPSRLPTIVPSRAPSKVPSRRPTRFPTLSPSFGGTVAPTVSYRPTFVPISTPTRKPTSFPTISPSFQPTNVPTHVPTPVISGLVEKLITFPVVVESGVDQPTAWNLELSVEPNHHNDSCVSFNTRSFCYNGECTYPGPTILVKPGDVVSITVNNNLEANNDVRTLINTLHSPNSTALITHGLFLVPPLESESTISHPGESTVITLHIHPEHSPGLHWYYSNYHGSSSLHLMNGLLGAIIVSAVNSLNNNTFPTSISESYDNLLVLTKLNFIQEVSDNNKVSQGCNPDDTCDPISQAPLCSGNTLQYNILCILLLLLLIL
jgi:plastocyanin